MIKNVYNDFITQAWIVIAIFCLIQIIYLLIAHTLPFALQSATKTAEQREFLSSIFYIIAIISFPLTNLIRAVQLRLNATLSCSKSLSKRYFITVVISQIIMAIIGLFGFIMFMLGDNFNTLYIFSLLAFLGFFLHRPKKSEYQQLRLANSDR
jgi:nitrate reductase NapE component